jgi:hypothetical protein
MNPLIEKVHKYLLRFENVTLEKENNVTLYFKLLNNDKLIRVSDHFPEVNMTFREQLNIIVPIDSKDEYIIMLNQELMIVKYSKLKEFLRNWILLFSKFRLYLQQHKESAGISPQENTLLTYYRGVQPAYQNSAFNLLKNQYNSKKGLAYRKSLFNKNL